MFTYLIPYIKKRMLFWKVNNIFWDICFFLLAIVLLFLGGAPTSVCHIFRPSVHLSVHPSIWPSIRPSVCLLHSISQEPYIIWSWFLLHICEMMISSGFFFIFSKFWFFSPKWEITITSVMHHISGTVHHLIIIFGTLV